MMRLVPLLAHHVVLEPGDGTHYEFLVSRVDDDYYFVASVGSVAFAGYPYRVDDVRAFASRHPWIVPEGPTGPAYMKTARSADPMGDGFLSYVLEHSLCNPWTVLAAIRAVLAVLETEAARPFRCKRFTVSGSTSSAPSGSRTKRAQHGSHSSARRNRSATRSRASSASSATLNGVTRKSVGRSRRG